MRLWVIIYDMANVLDVKIFADAFKIQLNDHIGCIAKTFSLIKCISPYLYMYL